MPGRSPTSACACAISIRARPGTRARSSRSRRRPPRRQAIDMTIYSDAAHFGDYNPADFGWGARDPMQNPALLVPFSYRGVSFGSMHVDAVSVFTAILDELVPLIGGTPNPVPGEDGCFNPNSVTVGGTRSFHQFAIAI